jgi:hypothetical protein
MLPVLARTIVEARDSSHKTRTELAKYLPEKCEINITDLSSD